MVLSFESLQISKWDKVLDTKLDDVNSDGGKSKTGGMQEEAVLRSAWGSQGRLTEETALDSRCAGEPGIWGTGRTKRNGGWGKSQVVIAFRAAGMLEQS